MPQTRRRPRKKDQAHDAIFKTFFSDAIIVRNYLLHYTADPDFHYWLTDLSQIPQQLILQKRESEILRNLFLALKLARNEALVRENWKKILTFEVQIAEGNRVKILFQSLTLYSVKLFDKLQTEAKNLSKELPDSENSWVEAIPEIFGEKWKKAGMRKGIKEGIKEGVEFEKRNFSLKTIQKFPEWSNEEVASFVGVSVEYVQ